MKRNLLLGWISLFGVLAFAQEDPVVMRINGKDIPRSEFEYSYRRHADGNGMKLSPKEYAEFFIQSKLKVEAARAGRTRHNFGFSQATGGLSDKFAEIIPAG